MYEAIPVTKRYRMDLKPGTAFHYNHHDAHDIFHVNVKHAACPLANGLGASTAKSAGILRDREVTVLWEPPAETAPVAEDIKPETKAQAALAAKAAKVPLHLCPPALMIGAARAYAEGEPKYGFQSWRNPDVKIKNTEYIAAILRHALAYQDGEDVDPESSVGKLHLEGIAATVGIMLDCLASGTLIESRKKGPAGEMLRRK